MWYLIRLRLVWSIFHEEVLLSLRFSLSKLSSCVLLNKDGVESLVFWLYKVVQMVRGFIKGPSVRRSLAVRVLERIMCTLELTPYLGLFLLVCLDCLWWSGRAALIGKVREGFRTRMSSKSAVWGKEGSVIMRRRNVNTYVLITINGCSCVVSGCDVCCGVSTVSGRLRLF